MLLTSVIFVRHLYLILYVQLKHEARI